MKGTILSPHICEFSYSVIAQRTRDFQERANNSSRTDNSRLVWMKFVTQYIKYQEMINVCEFLKTKKLMQKLRIRLLHISFNKFYKKMIIKRWRRFQTHIVLKNIKEKYQVKGLLMKEARAQHTSYFINESPEFAIPNLTSLLANASHNQSKRSDIQAIGDGSIGDSCQEREIKLSDTKPTSTRKDAHMYFGIALLILLMISLLIVKNWNFFNFLFSRNDVQIPVVEDDSLFWQNDAPSQKDVIDQVLKII